MSCFFVGRATVDAVCTLIASAGPTSVDELNRLGRAIWNMNADAFEARYGYEKGSGNAEAMADLPTMRAEAAAYTYNPRSEPIAALYKSLRCLLYQCAEGSVDETQLYRTLDTIATRLTYLSETPEYEAAPWGLCA